MAALHQRRSPVLHMIYNLLEQDPGHDLATAAREVHSGILVRVPHSSGLLEGKFTAETTFDSSDHRSFRSREWLLDGLQKMARLQFLTEGTSRTIGQAALKWLLADPIVASVLPNIYNEEQLLEFAAAPDTADLTTSELDRIADLYQHDFYRESVAAGVAQ